MLVYLNQAYGRHQETARREGRPVDMDELRQAVIEGALLRVRPIMMTVAAIIAGLLPIMLGSGTGSEVMRRIAAPMVGGMVSATVLTLLVIPAAFLIWRGMEIRRHGAHPAGDPRGLPDLARHGDTPAWEVISARGSVIGNDGRHGMKKCLLAGLFSFAILPGATLAAGQEGSHGDGVGTHQHAGWMAPPGDYAGRRGVLWEDGGAVHRGRIIYGRKCAACHGWDGKGTGRMAKSLPHPPADLTSHFHKAPDQTWL